MKHLGLAVLLFCGVLHAANEASLGTLKMQRRFGAGISVGGPLAYFGLEADVNVSEDFSLSGGLGTGLDYSTFMVKARYFLMGEWVSPYVAVSFARWWTGGTDVRSVSPSALQNRFLEPGQNLAQGFSVYLIAPTIGVQFMHKLGFAVSAELMYLFKLFGFESGTYGGLAAHWYF